MAKEKPETIAQGWQRRFGYTPICDMLRGKGLTGRYDFEWRLGQTLPPELSRPIYRALRGMHLRNEETHRFLDVLARRCRRNLNDGVPAEAIIARYRRKATRKAIRRRHIRRRHWIDRAICRSPAWLGYAALALIGLYAITIPYFYFSRPTVSVDYLAQFNATAAAVPEDERAWPEYVKVYAMTSALERELNKKDRQTAPFGRYMYPAMDAMTPAHPRWEEKAAILEAHTEWLEMIRQATEKPSLGHIARLPYEINHEEAAIVFSRNSDDPTKPPDCLIAAEPSRYDTIDNAQILYRSILHELSFWLVADAYLALERDDPERYCVNIEAVFRMAHHAESNDGGVFATVGLGLRESAYGCIADAVEAYPHVLEDGHLTRLAQAAARPIDGVADGIDHWRMLMLDELQHSYTDDGPGGGHLTPDGLIITSRRIGQMEDVDPESSWVRLRFAALTPAAVLLGPSRNEMERRIDEMITTARLDMRTPMYELAESRVRQANDHYWREENISLFWLGNCGAIAPLLFWGVPSYRHYTDTPREMFARCEATRQGAATAIAIERYRRAKGQLPTELGELVPDYLDAAPMDQITSGEALYLARDGRPIVYSVGTDRDDDEGRPPTSHFGVDHNAAMRWAIDESSLSTGWYDGDWMMVPSTASWLERGRESAARRQRELESEVPYFY